MFFETPADVSAGMQLMMQRLSVVTTEEGVSRGLSFKPRSDDVFVLTPRKCGTTWMQQILHQLRSGGDMSFDDICDVIPYIELAYHTEIDLEAEHVYQPRVQTLSMMLAERYKTFCTEENVVACRKDAIPKNTRKHTSWGVNVYKDCAESRNEAFKDFQPDNPKFPIAPEDPSLLSVDEINYWLSKFCVDVRQKNGEEYRHEVLYSLFCALNRVIRESHRNLVLFKSPELKPFQDALDGPPLRDLTKKNAKFVWSEIHQNPFNQFTEALSSAPCVAYFSKHKETYVTVDACPVSISAILSQKSKGLDDEKTVAYASRALTDVERRHSQTEKEALAIIWEVEHFHLYLPLWPQLCKPVAKSVTRYANQSDNYLSVLNKKNNLNRHAMKLKQRKEKKRVQREMRCSKA
ncbi:Retrovirus-related Pol poly from transposon [Paramuricea clavata]|uniref:Retrovirus-related Pol poly from transposon n=1 Tax=Paramuricea clavata TaxID=317549 RepID=A0A7D9DSX6_PARCT|nr:Retrovirus-related Pol poly from transposon [Paramuricea clavata]